MTDIPIEMKEPCPMWAAKRLKEKDKEIERLKAALEEVAPVIVHALEEIAPVIVQALRDEREACVARISDLYFKSDPPSLNIVAVIEAIRNQKP